MSGIEFVLDPRIVSDTAFVADWPLSRVLLMNDRRFPWIMLVPRRLYAIEPFDLDAEDQAQLWREATQAARTVKDHVACQKMNVAALGNIVRQLHVHVVARHDRDAAWPGPVWGKGAAERYEEKALNAEVVKWMALLRPPAD